MSRTFQIDYETADRITTGILTETYHDVKASVDSAIQNGSDMHPDDVAYNMKLLPALKTVLDYFGVKVQ